MIRLAITAVTAAALCASPALAQFPGQAPAAPAFPGAAAGGFQINRADDANLTCEQILAEANPLNEVVTGQKQAAAKKLAEDQAAAEKAANGRRIAGNLLGGALALGAQAGMMRGMMGSAAGRQAITAASQGASAIQANANAQVGQVATTAAAPTPEEQRMSVLLSLYTSKRCG